MIENTNAMKSAAYVAYNETANSFQDYLGQHATSLAVIFDNGKPHSKLATEQQLIYDAYMMKMLNSMEATYLHHRDGTMPDDVFEGKVVGFQQALQTGFQSQDWLRLRGGGFSKDFQRFMEDEIIGEESDDA